MAIRPLAGATKLQAWSHISRVMTCRIMGCARAVADGRQLGFWVGEMTIGAA